MSNKYLRTAALCVLFIVLFGVLQASAHDWYSFHCCGSQHCHPISSCSEILETTKGVVWNGIEFTKDMIHPSQDNQCHVCITEYNLNNTSQQQPMCVYVQQGS